ncbi:hypothetical protein C8Q73DRAFT_794325 [Cubamyces lactineus]|nr:hypothetical protein C8Q73DRAFT_794325 [Cubamyces lactineus]
MFLDPAFAPVFAIAGLAGLARLVGAQTTPTIPPCALPCIAQAAASGSGCTSFTDVECICKNSTLISMIGRCVAAACPADVQQQAVQLFQTECEPFLSTSEPATSSTTPASESSSSHAATTSATSSHATSESHTASESHTESGTHLTSGTSRAESSATGTATRTGTVSGSGMSTLTVPPTSITSGLTSATALPVSASGDAANSTRLLGNGTMTASSGTIVSTGTSGPSNTMNGAMTFGVQMGPIAVLTVAAAMFGAGVLLSV